MNILVINSGSSSVKYQLYDMSTETLKVKGRIERIGSESAQLVRQAPGREEWNEVREVLNHSMTIEQMIRLLVDPILGVIKSIRDIHGVGHRVVHGGEAFTAEALIDEEVKRQIRKLYDLAPLHNPAHMVGITAVEQRSPGNTTGGGLRYRIPSDNACSRVPVSYS